MIIADIEAYADQQALRESVAGMIAKLAPADAVVLRAEAAADGEPDNSLWQALSGDFAANALLIPVCCGGAGASFAEAAVVLEEVGAALSTVPYLSTLIAVELLCAGLEAGGANPVAEHWLPRIADGTATATVAFDPTTLGSPGSEGGWQASEAEGAWTLSGMSGFVLDGHTADLVLIPVHGEDVTLFAVRGEELDRQLLDSVDLTRPLSRVSGDRVPAELVGADGGAAGSVLRARDVALVAVACEQASIGRRTLAMATEYARDRVQFGRRIGSFQAIKHALAEVAVAVDAAESAVAHGIWAVVEGSSAELAMAGAMAAVVCGDAGNLAAAENIQVHGGTGFTWEHSAHLYFRRALANTEIFGSRRWHADRLLEQARR